MKLTEKQFSDMVQERNDFEGSISLDLRGHYERLAAIAQYDHPAPAEANGELTEQQIKDANDAWNVVIHSNSNVFSSSDRNVIKAIASHVQYATTTPGAPLSDAEWAEARRLTSQRPGSDPMQYGPDRPSLNKVLAHRNVVQPAPAEVDEDVITRGMDEYFRVSKTPYSYPPNIVAGFNAFSHVLLDALRGPVMEEERKKLANNGAWPEILTKFLECRIEDRILKPKEKTFKEKVKEIISRATNSFPADVDKMSEEIAVLAEKNGGEK